MKIVPTIALIGCALQLVILGATLYAGSKQRISYVAYYPSMMGTKAQQDWMTSRNDVRIVRDPNSLPGMCAFTNTCAIDVQWCDENLNCHLIKRTLSDGTEERFP